MIPDEEFEDFTVESQPSKSYKMDLKGNSINGFTDGIEGVKQSIFKMLSTERYKYVIYPWEHGVELEDLFGKHISYVCAELKRRISEALIQDDRITSVDSFIFDTTKKRIVKVKFTVHTVFGDTDEEKEVNY